MESLFPGIIRIRDVKGKMIDELRMNCSENQMTVNISKVPNGIYYLSLIIDNSCVETHKLIKGRY